MVRNPLEDDHEGWLALRSALWPTRDLDRHHQEMNRVLGDPARRCVLVHAAEDGSLDGFVEVERRGEVIGEVEGPVALLVAVFVAPARRRAGCARSLVEAAARWAADQGCRSLAVLDEGDTAGVALDALGLPGVSRVTVRVRSLPDPAPAMSLPPTAAESPTELLPAPARSRWPMHVAALVIGLTALAVSDVWSGDPLRGALAPLVAVLAGIYFIALVLAHRYMRRADPAERGAALFDVSEERD